MNTKIISKVFNVILISATLLGVLLIPRQSVKAQEGILYNIFVNPHDGFIYACIGTWPHGTVVDLTITRAGEVIYTASATVQPGPGNNSFPIHYPDEVAYFNLFNPNPPYEPIITLQPGDILNLTGGGISRSMTIWDLRVTYVDVSLGTIEGRADPGNELWVNACSSEGYNLMPDSTGYWIAYFTPGVITPYSCGGTLQHDSSGNTEQSGFVPPESRFSMDKSQALVGTNINLDASASSDYLGLDLIYEWDFDEDGIYDDATGITTQVSFSKVGYYWVYLRVTEPGGLMGRPVRELVEFISWEQFINPNTVRVQINPIPIKTTVNASASFTGAFEDTFTASWNWGDGTSSNGTVTRTENDWDWQVSGSHTYTTPGIYNLTLTVTDAIDYSVSDTFESVIVFDPNSGRITGSGNIITQANGLASFDFTAYYPKDSNYPVGNTGFKLQSGGLKFISSHYKWMSVNLNDHSAILMGSGTINKQSGYDFMIKVYDYKGIKPVKLDTFYIIIWQVKGGTVVFDTVSQRNLTTGDISIK